MRTASIIVVIGVHVLNVDVEVMYQPGEKRIPYYPDGSGYPGSPADVELIRGSVASWDAYGDVRKRCRSDVWNQLDELVDAHLAANWDGYRQAVLNQIGA